jgi:hypothetical protein
MRQDEAGQKLPPPFLFFCSPRLNIVYEQSTKKPYTWLRASQSDMATRVQMLGKEVTGWALLVLAILLFPIPVIPSVLLVTGLLALSSRYCWAAKLLARAGKVVPAPFFLSLRSKPLGNF